MNPWKSRLLALRRELAMTALALWRSALVLPSSGAFDGAAAIAYYAVLAVFPFILIVVMVGGGFLKNPELANQAIDFLSSHIPVAGDFLDTHLDTLQEAAGSLGLISGIGLFWSAMGLFTALRNGMDALNDTPRRGFLRGHWASFAAVLLAAIGLMLLIFLSTILGMFGSLSAVKFIDDLIPVLPLLPMIQTLSRLSSESVSFVAFLFLLRLLPSSRPSFRDCLVPALAVSVTEHLFRVLFIRFLLSRQDLNPIHGPLSAAIGFLGWAYASSLLVLWASHWVNQIKRLRESS
ncbi:MAG: YihY family protein [Fibrobacterota bacterium]|jgi:membrane protein